MIKDRQQLQELADTRALVSLYLDHAYTDEKISLILKSKKGFDFHVGPAWHLIVPFSEGGYVADATPDAGQYNIELARELIDEFDLKHSDLPALVFLGSSPTDEPFFAKLSGMTNDEIIDLVGSIGDLSKEELANGSSDPVEFRRRINLVVWTHLNRRELVRKVNKFAASPIVGLVGVGTGFFS